MTIRNHVGRIGRGLALTTAIVAAVGIATVPQQSAHALSTGAAVGIGLGAAALGTAVGAAAASPYYNGYYGYGYPGYYGYAPAYYPYAAPRSCWSPYYNTYVAC